MTHIYQERFLIGDESTLVPQLTFYIEQFAIVFETKRENGMAIFCRPFTTATLQNFDHNKLDVARV